MENPRQYKIPDWFLNRQKDTSDEKYSQVGNYKFSWDRKCTKIIISSRTSFSGAYYGKGAHSLVNFCVPFHEFVKMLYKLWQVDSFAIQHEGAGSIQGAAPANCFYRILFKA